jgi:hypothetical protein
MGNDVHTHPVLGPAALTKHATLAIGSEGVAQMLSPVGVDAVERLVERVDAHAGGVQVIGARPARRLDLARMCPGALLQLIEQLDRMPVAGDQLDCRSH